MRYFVSFESYENIRNTKCPISTYPAEKNISCILRMPLFNSQLSSPQVSQSKVVADSFDQRKILLHGGYFQRRSSKGSPGSWIRDTQRIILQSNTFHVFMDRSEIK